MIELMETSNFNRNGESSPDNLLPERRSSIPEEFCNVDEMLS